MDIESEVKEIFFEVFPSMPHDEFSWNKKQKDYDGWDSFAHLQLLTIAEEKFSIKLDVEESTSINSAKNLLDYIRSHT